MGVPNSPKDKGSSSNLMAGSSSVRSFRGGPLRELDDERYVRCRVVEENAVRLLAAFAGPFAVVSYNDDSRRLVITMLLQERKKIRQRAVRIGDFPIIEAARIHTVIGRRRIVGIMRIIQMHPDKFPLPRAAPGGRSARPFWADGQERCRSNRSRGRDAAPGVCPE